MHALLHMPQVCKRRTRNHGTSGMGKCHTLARTCEPCNNNRLSNYYPDRAAIYNWPVTKGLGILKRTFRFININYPETLDHNHDAFYVCRVLQHCLVIMDIVPVEASCVSTGRNCKRSCDNLDTGNYQTCSDCNGYMTCSSVGTVQTRCAPGLVWDDDMKGCTWKTVPSSESSKTCKCLRE